MLHSWLKTELTDILTELPPSPEDGFGRRWSEWGYSDEEAGVLGLPPVRMILIWDNLAGHHSQEIVQWCRERGIVPLYTPLGGSWLNMAESVQRIVVRRSLCGSHPLDAAQIMDWLAASVRGWNADPTPFEWAGKRWQRRLRARERRKLGGSGACTRRPIRRTKRRARKPPGEIVCSSDN